MSDQHRKPDQEIWVSNPGKQYAHQLSRALEKNNFAYRFFTSFWYKPGKFPFSIMFILPAKLRRKLEAEFEKRYFKKLNGQYIFQFPYFELIREVCDKIFGNKYSEKMQYYRDRLHDRWVASKMDATCKVFIGYEESSLRSFLKAKEKGIITVLDLAQVHYKTIDFISQQHSVFKDLFKDKKLRDKINKIKHEELHLADYVICLSDFAKTSLVKEGFNKDKIFVAHLGFDPLKFKAKQAYSTDGKLKVVFVGTITRRKGIDLLLEVHKHLSEIMDLTFVGPMADGADLLNSYKGSFNWHPYMEQGELNNVLNQSDLFVFPSYLDSWGMVVIEAMACGVPVIVSDHTGAGEVVINNSGFLIPAGDAALLEEKIRYFYENRNALKIMGENAKAEASKFTWDAYYEEINRIILKIGEGNERGKK
jgi:glycosyltransferase involved in cell wall biosynthesis